MLEANRMVTITKVTDHIVEVQLSTLLRELNIPDGADVCIHIPGSPANSPQRICVSPYTKVVASWKTREAVTGE